MLDRIEKLFSKTGKDCTVFIKGFNNVFYYSGFTSDDAYLLITPDKKFIITDSRYFVQAGIEAPDFALVDIRKGWGEIFSLVDNDVIKFTDGAFSVREYNSVKSKVNKTFVTAQDAIDFPRRNKDKAEIKIIAEAEAIGDQAFSYILPKLRTGMTELEVATEIENFMRREGATRTSFDTICASGVRSCMPHGIATDKVIEKGDFLTMDFGCVYKGYCSDMTRTVIFGEPTQKQREVYNTVLRAQNEVLENVSVGMKCGEVDTIARKVILDSGYGDNFTHALGHSVGIDIHESPVFSPKSSDTLEMGNVLSVEPGIYIDGEFGVRIEDLIAVTEDGILNLTHSPKELIII